MAHAVEDIAVVDTSLLGRKVVKIKRIGKVKKQAKTSKGSAAQSSKIPSTGAKLWLSCLGRKKLSASELIEVALKKLDLDESARVVIANRARAWLNASAKSGVVVTSVEIQDESPPVHPGIF